MLPARYGQGQSSALRKSRLEGNRPSMLPKPRRQGSTDRLSSEAWRPSTAGHRSSSAEPARGRLSKEASVTKVPMNGRSRSQQSERFGQSFMTPLRTSHHTLRPTTTPQRTPSEDRASRSWQTSLERALAFVTVKDQRPISNVAWQRSEYARVQEILASRGVEPLIRPLTITRFVDITGALLGAIIRDVKLNNDNYVTKLPHVIRRLLYPGTVSKSWLKTVNTLHAFPHALALIAYLLDLLTLLESPVEDEWLYLNKDEVSRLRREYLQNCLIRFQEPGHQFEDLTEEYLANLKQLLGDDDQKIAELEEIIQNSEAVYEERAQLDAAVILEEKRRMERRTETLNALREVKEQRRACNMEEESERARKLQIVDEVKCVDAEITRAAAESHKLKKEVEEQTLSVADKNKLLDEVDYAARVLDSKRTLAEQIDKMLLSKERELAQWQKKTLDSCVFYKQHLIHLSAHAPALARYVVDEKELMEPQCAECVCACVEALRARGAALRGERAERARRAERALRQHELQLEETQSKIDELKASIQRDQQTLDTKLHKESDESHDWAQEKLTMLSRVKELSGQESYANVETELEFWKKQELAWRTKLTELIEYNKLQREETKKTMEIARQKRTKLAMDKIHLMMEKLA